MAGSGSGDDFEDLNETDEDTDEIETDEYEDMYMDFFYNLEHFHYSIPHDNVHITNQKEEGSCQRIPVADMLTIVLRMAGITDPGLIISPQALLDSSLARNRQSLIEYCVNRGLESINTNPFICISRTRWNENQLVDERFRIRRILYYQDQDEITERLKGMFAPGGYRFPCVGVMRMGQFAQRGFSAQFAHGGLPYHHPVTPNDPQHAQRLYGHQHALLIVGLDTRSNNVLEHACKVKNSYGRRWGYRGYSRVGIDVFDYVLFPMIE